MGNLRIIEFDDWDDSDNTEKEKNVRMSNMYLKVLHKQDAITYERTPIKLH